MHTHGLDSWMARRRLKTPGKAALVFEDETLTYRRLGDTADQVSALLRRLGVGYGDRVAFLGENSPAFVQVLFGAVQLGAVFVPVNTRLAPPEIAHVLSDSGARVLVHDAEFADRLDAAGLGELPVRVVVGEGTADAPGLAALVRDAVDESRVPVEVPLDHPAAIIYTSGTTGKAKGAVLTHANLTWQALNCVVDYGVSGDDVALMISPLFHVASLGMGLLPAILTGATVVLERGFEAGRALTLIERHVVTMISGVPTTFQLMADHPSWTSTDLTSLRKLTCGGSAVPTRVLDAYEQRGLSFSQGYGMTETSPGATFLSPSMTREKQGSVGLPHFFTGVRVTDEHGQPAPVGEVGEIEITGPNVFAGYHENPEATASVFTADGWLRSGDLGYLDADGCLWIADRRKDMIISGGENIYPAEVEVLIADIDGVTGVAVIGIPDERWGEVPRAIVTVAGGASIDIAAVRAHLDGKVARYKLPKDLVIVAELPRTASGKVRKADLRARFGTP